MTLEISMAPAAGIWKSRAKEPQEETLSKHVKNFTRIYQDTRRKRTMCIIQKVKNLQGELEFELFAFSNMYKLREGLKNYV